MQVYCCASNPPSSHHSLAINEPCHSDHPCRRIDGTMRSSIKSIKVPSITPYEKILTQSRVWRSALNFVIASFFCAAICIESVIASLFCVAICLFQLIVSLCKSNKISTNLQPNLANQDLWSRSIFLYLLVNQL